MEGYQQRSGRGREEGKGTENKQHKWQVENRQGDVKNSIGNVETQQLICVNNGYEPGGMEQLGEGVQGRGE